MLAEERQMLWGLYRRTVVLRNAVRLTRGSSAMLYAAGGSVCTRYEDLRRDLIFVGIVLPGVHKPYPDGRDWLSKDAIFTALHHAMLALEDKLCPHQHARQLPPVMPRPETFSA